MTRTKARHIRRLRIAVRDPIVSRAHDFRIDLDVDLFARWGNFFDGCLHKNRDRRSEFRGRHRTVRLFPLNSFVVPSDLRSLAPGLWCERGDSNPHTFRYQILSLARLPIPPLSQFKYSEVENSTAVTRYRTASGSDRIVPGNARSNASQWNGPVATAPGSVTVLKTSGGGRPDS